jgi:hypothetical protein
MKRKKIFSALLAAVLFSTLLVSQALAAPSDTTRFELKGLIGNVSGAVAKRFNSEDNLGNQMDTVKIIANPAVSGQFLAVYHSYECKNGCGTARINLATSTDLINWTFIKALAGSLGNNATQPTIQVATDGGYVVAWEQEPSNHIKVAYYSSWANLQNGVTSKSYDILRTLSTCAEGTPNIYSASSTSVDIGFHYFSNCDVDRQARGTLSNFNSWTASAQPNIDNSLLFYGVAGNIGGRDKINYKTYNYALIEGQYTKNNFGTFRPFIYDYQTGNAEQITMTTPNNTSNFANPKLTRLQINGQWAIVVSMFIPSEQAGLNEKGDLIYYFWEPSSPVSLTTGGTVAVSSTNSPAAEAKEKAFDSDSMTKWLVFANTGWIQYQFGGSASYIVKSYKITSANDTPTRDPKDWTLKGSINGTTWTTLNTQTNQTFASRYQTNTYTFTNNTAYNYYRLDISANSGAPEIQLAELQLFDN